MVSEASWYWHQRAGGPALQRRTPRAPCRGDSCARSGSHAAHARFPVSPQDIASQEGRPPPGRALAPEEDLGLTKWRDSSADLTEEFKGTKTTDTQNTKRNLWAAEFTTEAAGEAGRRRGWFWRRDAAAVSPRPSRSSARPGCAAAPPPAPRHARASGPSLAVPASVSLQSAVGVLGGVLGKARLVRQRVVRKHRVLPRGAGGAAGVREAG